MDRFKQYLQQNADELGDEEPQEQLWNKISGQLTVDRKRGIMRQILNYAVAASVIGLIVAGAYFGLNQNSNKESVAQQKSNSKDSISKKVPIEIIPERPIIAATKITVPQKIKKDFTETKKENSTQYVMASVENSFITLISLQKEKVNRTPVFAEDPAYFNDFYSQLQQMDQDEKEVKEDIAKIGLTNEMLSRLINMYKQKLSVLEKLQTEINKTNTRYKQSKNPNEVQKNYFLQL